MRGAERVTPVHRTPEARPIAAAYAPLMEYHLCLSPRIRWLRAPSLVSLHAEGIALVWHARISRLGSVLTLRPGSPPPPNPPHDQPPPQHHARTLPTHVLSLYIPLIRPWLRGVPATIRTTDSRHLVTNLRSTFLFFVFFSPHNRQPLFRRRSFVLLYLYCSRSTSFFFLFLFFVFNHFPTVFPIEDLLSGRGEK